MSSSVREKMAQVIKDAKRPPVIVAEVKNEATPPIAEKPASKPQAQLKSRPRKRPRHLKKFSKIARPQKFMGVL